MTRNATPAGSRGFGKGGGADSAPLHRVSPPRSGKLRDASHCAGASPGSPQLPSLLPFPAAEYLQARIPTRDPVYFRQAPSGNTAHARTAQHACSARPPIETRTDLGQSLSAGCGRCLSAAQAPECPTGESVLAQTLSGLGSSVPVLSCPVLSRVRL